jgi:restriction endonuclease S subunit
MLEDNEKFRIDSEFFKKDFLNTYKLIKSNNNKQLKNIVDILTDFSANGSYESIANNFKLLDDKNYAYMVRTTDLETLNYTNNVKYIDKHAYNFLEKSQIFGGEILINKIGSPGRVYQMPKLNMPVSLGMNLFMLRLSKENNFTEEFIWAYFNSELGQSMIKRKINGTVPLTIDKEAIRTLYIPNLSKGFQVLITNLVQSSHQKQELSKTLYNQAEELLLKELDLLNFKPSKENIAIKTFKQSFGDSGRLDSEYYQLKYDEIINKIKSYKGGFKRLDNILIYINTGEYSEEYYRKSDFLSFYIRSTNINNGLVQRDENHFVDSHNFTRFVKEGDIVTARVGTLGVFGTIDNNLDNSIYSDNVLCFRLPDSYSSYVYTLFLNSKYNKLLIDRLARGSVQQRLNQETLKDLIIPIINNKIQTEIEEKIKESFSLKQNSKELLEVAKKAVEIAIENGEDEAMVYMKINLTN